MSDTGEKEYIMYTHSGLIWKTMFRVAVVGLFATMAHGATYSGGGGVMGDPFLISSPQDLADLANPDNSTDWDKHFLMTNDIDMSGITGFAPIGPTWREWDGGFVVTVVGTPFTGVFDGGGNTIHNLIIARPNQGSVGLFSGVSGASAQVKNLGLQGGRVVGTGTVGALVGLNNGLIEACRADVQVTGRDTGGLVGSNMGTVTACYAVGTISGAAYVGGLIGLNEGHVIACYARGPVSGGEFNSGLIGLSGGESMLVTQVLPTMTASFWDMEESSQSGSSGGKGLTTAQMKTRSIFQNADWGAHGWVMTEGQYPRLAWEGTGAPPIPAPLPPPFPGSGTKADPYRVATAARFALLSWRPDILDKHILLTADLDCSGTELHPIGDLGHFSGVFDGAGHAIRNAALVRPTNDFMGLFSVLHQNGAIKDLQLDNVRVKGRSVVGGLVAFTWHGTTTSCHVSGTINGRDMVGGLVGGMGFGTINYCSAACTLSGTADNIGGLAGMVGESVATNSRAIGVVTGKSYVGGLVGNLMLMTTGRIQNSYALGEASGDTYVGGLVGGATLYGGSGIQYSYAAVKTTGRNNIGGLVGRRNGTSPTSSFYDRDIGGPDNGIGMGRSTEQMRQQATFESAGWRFTGWPPPTWRIFEGKSYPHIRVLPIPLGSATDLELMNLAKNDSFVLTQDIDASLSAEWTDKSLAPGFMPIGAAAAPFNGHLDGQGYRILRLHIHRPDMDGTGLFGHLGVNGRICNLGLEEVSITGRNQTGALIGVNAGVIEQCYAQGAVSGAQQVGGLIGANSGSVSKSYAAAVVDAAAPGGLVGANAGGGANASFWDRELSGILSSGGGAALDTVAMHTRETYANVGWNMTHEWDIVDGQSYPFMRNSAPLRILSSPPRLINADNIAIELEAAVPNLFVTAGGGAYPAWHKFSLAEQAAITIPLKQEAINGIVISVLSETGEERVIAQFIVNESDAFPSAPTPISSLALYPASTSLAEDAAAQFQCIATFANGAAADVTAAVNYYNSGGVITGGGLYTHRGGTATLLAMLYDNRRWLYSNTAVATTSKGTDDKSGTGLVTGEVRSQYTGLSLPSAELTAYHVMTPGVAARHDVYAAGNYAFFLPENVYHFEALAPGFRSSIKQGGIFTHRLVIDPGPPEVFDFYYTGQVRSSRALQNDFALRPNDAQAPWVYYIEPTTDCVVKTPHLVVTAINADKYSELAIATFTLNASPYDIVDRISSTGFYRDTWELSLGLNVLHLFSMDTEGNAAERTLEVTYDPSGSPEEDPPPPAGPPAVECVRMAIVNLANGASVRGNAITLLAEPIDGDLGATDAVNFEIKGAGTGNVWLTIDASLAAPHMATWDATSFPEGAYQLRATAISLAGCVDRSAETIEVIVSAVGTHHERTEAGTHALTTPVSVGATTVLAIQDGARFARIVLPANALTTDDVLTAHFPNAALFTPSLTPWQADAELYLDVALSHHSGNFLNGKRAIMELSYPDADDNGALDDTAMPVSQLTLQHLPTPAGAFAALPASSVAQHKRCVVGESSHFSVFGVVAEHPMPPLNLLADSLPDGQVGAAYDAALEASGGAPPHAWSVASGALPPGLSISGANISGMPTTPGQFAFTLQVSDAQSTPSIQSINLEIVVFAAARPTVTVTRAAGQDAVTNNPSVFWDIVFSEDVTGYVDPNDIVTLTGTAAPSATYAVSGSGAAYTLEITDLPYDGVLRPRVLADAVESLATGAPNRPSNAEPPVQVDRGAPTAILGCALDELQEYGTTGPIETSALPIIFTLTFNEDVTGLDATDIVFEESGPVFVHELFGAGKSYTLLVQSIDIDAAVTPVISAGAAFDAAGNPNAEMHYAGREVHYAADPRPTVVLNQRTIQEDPTNALPILFDVNFSAPVSGFGATDVAYVVSGDSAPGPAFTMSGGGTDYTLTVSATAGDGRLAFYIPETAQWRASTSVDNQVDLDTSLPSVILRSPSTLKTDAGAGSITIPVHYVGATTISLDQDDVILDATLTAQAQVLVSGWGSQQRNITLYDISGYGALAVRIAPGTAANAAGNLAPGAGPSRTILVGAPTADFSASPTSGPAPLAVQFMDASISGAMPIDAWQWDLGDGAVASESDPLHLYEAPGVYTVTLTVTTPVASDTVVRTDYVHVMAGMAASGIVALILLTAVFGVCGIMIMRVNVVKSSS